MSRHRRQRHRRQARGLRKVFDRLDENVILVSILRYNNTGLFPKWITSESKQAIMQFYGIKETP